MLSHLYLGYVVWAPELQCIVFPNLKVRCVFGFGGIWKHDGGMGKVAIVETLRWGESASFCCNCDLASLSANASPFDRLIPIFTGHVLGTIGQSNMYFFLLPTHTTLDVISTKPKLILHIVGGAILLLQTLVHGGCGAMFANSDFGIA